MTEQLLIICFVINYIMSFSLQLHLEQKVMCVGPGDDIQKQ